MKDKTGGSAFPESGLSGLPNDQFIHPNPGMTLRDYFAAKAMQTLVQGYAECEFKYARETANVAYEFADAMVEAREK